MRRFDAGVSGGASDDAAPRFDASRLRPPWPVIVSKLARGRALRPVQANALVESQILDSRQHLLVCAPTNSGKSLIGYLVLLEAVMQGRRAVLLEPLRALAQEQAAELEDVLSDLSPDPLPRAPRVRISTGDYRFDGEWPSAPPPEGGEIVVATPERLDAILRNPAHAQWASTIGAVVVDEAHLISDARRGPTLELLVATMLSLPSPPRLALLSASVGEPERVREWLAPCQLITSTSRTPLAKEVWSLDDAEAPDEVLTAQLQDVLQDPSASAIVFVYKRASAATLATRLSGAGCHALPYHSGQSMSERARTRSSFLSGACRVVVATTALAMGVNLPASHVFVRDTTFFGAGRLRVDELLQILGRAGRGERSGTGIVLLRSGDSWCGEELAHLLLQETLPPLRSTFEPLTQRHRRAGTHAEFDEAIAGLVATCMSRDGEEGATTASLATLLGNTLGARSIVPRLEDGMRWLMGPSRALAFRDDRERFHLTVLGRAGVRSMLPLNYVAGLGQLARDLVSLDVSSKLLNRWSSLDHLFVLALMSERTPSLRRFSEGLAEQIDGWLEQRPSDAKSLLFGEWVMGSPEKCRVDELFGSLGLDGKHEGPGSSRKRAYVAMLSALILDERSRGVSVADVERRWDIVGLDGVEESWRDTALWILAGHATVFDIRSFYHHLREYCAAGPDHVREAKHALGRMRAQAYDLIEAIKYCSPLGVLMRGVRDVLRTSDEPTLGVSTIRRLETAGVLSMQEVAKLDLNALVAIGVQRRFAKQIHAYIRRRMR